MVPNLVWAALLVLIVVLLVLIFSTHVIIH